MLFHFYNSPFFIILGLVIVYHSHRKYNIFLLFCYGGLFFVQSCIGAPGRRALQCAENNGDFRKVFARN